MCSVNDVLFKQSSLHLSQQYLEIFMLSVSRFRFVETSIGETAGFAAGLGGFFFRNSSFLAAFLFSVLGDFFLLILVPDLSGARVDRKKLKLSCFKENLKGKPLSVRIFDSSRHFCARVTS